MLDLSQIREWTEQDKNHPTIRCYRNKDALQDMPSMIDEIRLLQENNRELTTDRDRWMEANGANTVSLHHCYTEIDQLKSAYKAMREALQFIASTPGKDVKEGVMADRMRNKARTTLTQYPEEPQ